MSARRFSSARVPVTPQPAPAQPASAPVPVDVPPPDSPPDLVRYRATTVAIPVTQTVVIPGSQGPPGPQGPPGAPGPAGPPGSAGPLVSRLTTSYTTTATLSGTREQGTVAMAHGYRILHVITSVPCRTRLYTTAANQATDATRTAFVDPPEGSGLVLEYITQAGFLGGDTSPVVDGASMETTPVTNIPITIDLNASGPATITFTYVQTEA